MVPIILIFFSFATKQAIALSNCCIFAGSLTRFILNFKQTHPNKDAKSIDYNIVMVMLPMVLMGSTIGVQINAVLPELLLLIGMTALIVFIAIKSIFNAIKVKRKEVRNRIEQSSLSVSCNNSNSNENSKSKRNDNEVEGAKDEESENEGGAKDVFSDEEENKEVEKSNFESFE